MQTISDIMTSKVVTVTPRTPLFQLASLLNNYRIHHLLVVDENDSSKLVGIVSDRDVLLNLSSHLGKNVTELRAEDAATLHLAASTIMTANPIAVGPDSSLREAASLILSRRISALPVVDASGRLVGIVSWKDLLRFCAEHLLSIVDPV